MDNRSLAYQYNSVQNNFFVNKINAISYKTYNLSFNIGRVIKTPKKSKFIKILILKNSYVH